MHETRLTLLAGGMGVRMGRLGHGRLKPLIPFGGACHLIDFSIENARRSGASEVLLMPQYNTGQLLRYLLQTWCSRPGFQVHLGAYQGVRADNVDATLERVQRPAERGTADALIKNAPFIFGPGTRDVMVLHADHVYQFDYQPMLEQHRRSGAALTIGYQEIELEYVKLFGMVQFDDQGNLRSFVEKPAAPTANTVFSAVCVFNADVLQRYLALLDGSNWQHDISRDVIPAMLAGGETIKGFRFTDYWEDIGTVERYLRANLRMLDAPPTMALSQLPVTIAPEVARRYVAAEGSLRQAIVGADFTSGASIERCIVYPGAHVADSALLRNSIVLPGAVVAPGARLDNAIVLPPDQPGRPGPLDVIQLEAS